MSLSALSAMEQYSQYLMWMKSKHILNSHFGSSMMNPFNNSWEKQALADDAAGAGPLGGFIWPPRSYSCSFCKREFRSAQALGGHMNVHRRDRAKLKQSLTSPQQSVVFLHPSKSSLLDLDASYPSQVFFLDSNPNPNPNPSFVSSSSPHSPSRVSAITTQEYLSEPTYVSPFSSSIVQEHLKGFPLSSPLPRPPPQSNSETVEIFYDSDSKTAFEKNAMKENFETNLSMGLNLVVSQNRPSVGSDCDDQAITSKRHKTNVSSMPFFVKPCSDSDSDDRYHFQSEVLGLKNGSFEDLDLELRLGDSPKVK